jgi:protein AATF/BFR2
MPPSKKKSRSEALNEELNPFASVDHADFAEDAPAVEDYDFQDDERSALRSSTAPAPPGGKKAATAGRQLKDKQRLRRRGPLDDSLSSGKYAAVPRGSRHAKEDEDGDDGLGAGLEDGWDEAHAGANIDDIFGMFDERADEHNAGLKTEEDLGQFLEQRFKARGKRTVAKKRARNGADVDVGENGDDDAEEEKDYGHLDEGDAEVMRQIDALRKQQKLNVTAETTSENVADLDRDMKHARECVALFSQLLSFRLKVQPAVNAAVRLPQYYAAKAFRDHSGKVREQWDDVRAAARSLAVTMARAMGAEPKSEAPVEKLWSLISARHTRMMSTVNASVARWGHRAQAQNDPKLKAVNRPLLEQIRGVIGGKQRLLHRAQRNRAHVHIFGHPQHFEQSPADRAVAIADGDADRELFDDGDFVKELALHHGSTAEKLAKLLPEDASKAEAKKGHHRKTKGRTVNYDPRPKIVGFMMPVAYDESDRYDALLTSLFGSTGTN